MGHFYTSIIFIGITLIFVSMIWIVYDRKKSHDYATQVDMKKKELESIIMDAEQMVEELNKFSEYIVTKMENKNEELFSSLNKIEERISRISSIEGQLGKAKEIKSTNEVAEGNSVDVRVGSDDFLPKISTNSDLIIENIDMEANSDKKIVSGFTTEQETIDKIVPLNSKYREVIRLANTGMSHTEIAKSLNMGKGEVQLIIGVNK